MALLNSHLQAESGRVMRDLRQVSLIRNVEVIAPPDCVDHVDPDRQSGEAMDINLLRPWFG